MKCLNMKISDILLFVLNFVSIYQIDVKESKIFPTTTLVYERVRENELYKNCPQLSKIIYDNITDYTINCKPLKKKNPEMNEETVLQHACFIVNDMLIYICEKKLNATSDLLKIDNFDSICPFNFSHLKQLGFKFSNKKVMTELTQTDHCLKVCSDLYSNKIQCVLLSKLNRYLKSNISPGTEKALLTSKVDKSSAKSEQIGTSDCYSVNTLSEKKEKLVNNDPTEVSAKEKLDVIDQKLFGLMKTSKPMKDANKIEKPLIMPTPNTKFKASERATKVPENENHLQAKNEDPNGDEQMISDDYMTSLDGPSDKIGSNQVSNLPKIVNFEDKIDSSPKGKEIYSGEGFFQAEDSHFFFYFIMVSSVIVVGYLAFHNKNKILAYALEGTSGRRSRRRPNPARYRKLETNLEEIISSNLTNTAASSVVY